MTRGFRWCALLVTMVTLVGCTAAPRPAPASTIQLGPPLDYRRAEAKMHLDRWDAVAAKSTGRAFVPVEDTVRVVGQWEPALAVGGPELISSGNLWPAPQNMPAHVDPKLPHVRWADGADLAVDLLPVNDAGTQMRNVHKTGGACSAACSSTFLSPARLVTDTIDTTSGTATAPFWSWGVKGSKVRIEKLAVRMPVGISVDPVPTYNVTDIEAALISSDGWTLTVVLEGGWPDASKPCGHDYHVVAVESDHAVVPIVIDTTHNNTVPCNLGGYFRTASVKLSRPLGDRTVLAEFNGEPVPTNLT